MLTDLIAIGLMGLGVGGFATYIAAVMYGGDDYNKH